MKTMKTFCVAVVATLFATALYSCSGDDDSTICIHEGYSIGVATLKPISGDAYYLQWDDTTTLWPAMGVTPYFGVDRERRVLVNFTVIGNSAHKGVEDYDYTVRVNKIDSVLTKQIAPNIGEKNDSVYGIDPVRMKSVWIEDGYINFQFETYFDGMTKHFVNLVETDMPNSLEFRHNAYGNFAGGLGWGLVAFRLDSLPEASGDDEVTLTIRYRSYEGDKSIQLRYKPGSFTDKGSGLWTDSDFQQTN